MPKFVLERSEKTIPVKLVVDEYFLEVIATDDNKFLISINMADGKVTVNENSQFGLKYSHSIR